MRRWSSAGFLLCLLVVLPLLGCRPVTPKLDDPRTAATVSKQSTATPDVDAGVELPFDPAVRHGQLKNGLQYYVRANSRPQARAQLWLAVDAGSILEDDDQRGLAHFVEHMAFNGTKRFRKQEIVEFLESIGMTFGPDVNAYTSFDETVYMLNLPTDDPAILTKGLSILHEWAAAIRFDALEVDKERGVVLEEWRRGRGAGARLRDVHFPVLLAGSRYADRLAIGDPQIIETAPVETLVQFYRDWYRPDLMTVIAVGDFDVDVLEASIRDRFGDLTSPESLRPRPKFDVPAHPDLKISIASDPEQTTARANVYDKRPARGLTTEQDYRELLIGSLYSRMLGARFDELSQQPEVPFLYAGAGPGGFVRDQDAFSTSTSSAPDKIGEALYIARREVERAARHGFSAGELQRAKAALDRSYEQSYRERDKRRNRSLAQEMLSHFLEREGMPGIEWERRFVGETLPDIKLEEITVHALDWAQPRNRVVSVSLPGEARDSFDNEAAAAAIARAASEKLAPWLDDALDEPLVKNPPRAGQIIAEREIPPLGVQVWTLSNGAEIWLKPTDFQNDRILFYAFSMGGDSLATDEHWLDAGFAGDVASVSGIGEFSDVQLQKALAGKRASLSAWISTYEQGFSGSASPEDLETLLQLTWLRARAPRYDADAVSAMKKRLRTYFENRLAAPTQVFNDRFTEVLYNGHPRTSPLTPERIDEVDPDVAFAFYRERMTSPGGMTYFLVGNLDLEVTRDLVQKWLAPLPATDGKDRWHDAGIRPVLGQKSFTVHKGLEPKSSVRLYMHGPADWTPDSAHLASSVAAALRIRLREILREEMGGTYGVSVSGYLSRRPQPASVFQISFQCAPENVEDLVEAMQSELDRFMEEGVPEEVAAKVREGQRRDRETSLRENGFWRSALSSAVRYDRDPEEINQYDHRIDRVTPDTLRDAARQYLHRTNSVLGILYPEAPVTNANRDQEEDS